MKNIYVMGECVMDFVKNEAAGDKGYRRGIGGCAVNVSRELARLIKACGGEGGGITPCIVARTGNDTYGREIEETLKAEGINTLYLKTDAAPTSEVRMDICADGHRRCAGRYNGADVNLCADDIKDIALKRGDAVCITSGGFLSENGRSAHMRMLQKAQGSGALICFDLNIREGLWEPGKARELLLPVIALSGVIKIKGHELKMLLGEPRMEPLLTAAKSCFFAVYTEGAAEKRYKCAGYGAETAVEKRRSERRGGGIGTGDELFAEMVFEAVKG